MDLEAFGLDAIDLLKGSKDLDELDDSHADYSQVKKKQRNRKPILFSSESQEEFDTYIALKAHFAAENSSDLFSPIMFGSDAKKAVIHDEISLSNQLLVNKRKSLLKFLKKTTERFTKRNPN